MKISDRAVKTINILHKIFFILCIVAFIAGIAISSSGLKAQWFSSKNTNNNSNSGNQQDYGGGSYIPPTHTHNYTVYQVVNPTCTEKGYTVYYCSGCGGTYKGNYVNATGHNYVKNGTLTRQCALSNVSQSFICSVCSATKTEKADVQGVKIPDTHKNLNENDTCEFCGWQVYMKNDNSILMINDKGELSAEYYGQTIYNFGSNKARYITNVYLSDSVTSIGSDAFSSCRGLTSITIPDSVTSIGSDAFSSCSSLTSITIPNSVTSIGYGAFRYCSSLTSITIPDSVTSIGGDAFSSCSSLTSITIPNSVTSIGYGAFRYCSSLTSITIPDSVTSIGGDAFYNCSSLTSITIPDSVTSIGGSAFYYCSSLTSITFKGTKAEWNAINKGNNWEYGVPLTCKINCTDGTVQI